MKYSKKYSNADFYKNGEFQQDVAIEAMKDMFKFYNVPFTPLMEKDMWVTDFGLGDFENVGMGGIFWVNDPEFGYFAHAIYLLPGQMIPEHAHVATIDFPAKHESWMVNHGWVYNFAEIGEEIPDAPAVPAAHGPVKSRNFVVQNVGDVLRLKELGTFHFMMAGPEGAIVDEWACYHDNAGLRFTNPTAVL
jgi:D-lyxose ketol-isomerase